MSQHSKYIISIVKPQDKQGKNPDEVIHAIAVLLGSTPILHRRRSRAFFEIYNSQQKCEFFVGKFVLYKSTNVDIANSNRRETEPKYIDNKVIDAPRFLCFIKENNVFIAHRCNKNEKSDFREKFNSACKNKYRLTNLKLKPIFQQISQLKHITEIVICMKNNKGKNDATDFMEKCSNNHFFSSFLTPDTFNQSFKEKCWKEKSTKSPKSETGLIQFSEMFHKWLKSEKGVESKNSISEYIKSLNNYEHKLRRIELATLIAAYSEHFSCKILGYLHEDKTLPYLIDFDSNKESEIVIDVYVPMKIDNKQFDLKRAKV